MDKSQERGQTGACCPPPAAAPSPAEQRWQQPSSFPNYHPLIFLRGTVAVTGYGTVTSTGPSLVIIAGADDDICRNERLPRTGSSTSRPGFGVIIIARTSRCLYACICVGTVAPYWRRYNGDDKQHNDDDDDDDDDNTYYYYYYYYYYGVARRHCCGRRGCCR